MAKQKRRRAPARLAPKPKSDAGEQAYIGHVKRELGGIVDSAFMIQLFSPSMVTDWKDVNGLMPIIHIGACVMLDKPLVITVRRGDAVPPKLAGIADEIVWLDDHTSEAFDKAKPAMVEALKRLRLKYPELDLPDFNETFGQESPDVQD